MKFIPSSPLLYVAILVAVFLLGLSIAKFFTKKGKKEKFNDSYYGLPSTVTEFADSPKVLPPVPENKGVTTHDEWCDKFNC
ncbi:hypothetical protein ATCVOR07043_563L [Acanthocystis turfacea Chlorella virus OR0704.3]|nr:hypothetical protein ATCVOR07043_563L [Acanthocystis turfacea Chlorella virus OR0704.3]